MVWGKDMAQIPEHYQGPKQVGGAKKEKEQSLLQRKVQATVIMKWKTSCWWLKNGDTFSGTSTRSSKTRVKSVPGWLNGAISAEYHGTVHMEMGRKVWRKQKWLSEPKEKGEIGLWKQVSPIKRSDKAAMQKASLQQTPVGGCNPIGKHRQPNGWGCLQQLLLFHERNNSHQHSSQHKFCIRILS